MAQLSEQDIFRRLEQLERAINVPVESGEARAWLDSVAREAEEVQRVTSEYFRVVHPELYRSMNELDPEQHPRVQALEQEDGEICASLRDVLDFSNSLRKAGDAVEPDERLLSNAIEELSEKVINIVLRIRKHETQLSTWHLEAMSRDRGTVD